MGLLVEDVDEAFADDLAFAFRLGDAGELAEEFGRCVDADHIQTEAFVVVEYIAELVFAQHAVVNEDTGQILADSAVEKHCGHRRIDAAAQSEHYFVVAQLLLELSHGRFDE